MSIGKLGEFDVKSGLWSSYKDRLDMYFKVNNVEAGMQLPTLIATMGDEAYELLVNLASPKKPSELKYDEASQLMTQHLQPTPSSLAERYRFRQRRQCAGEDVAVYVAELKRLSRNCKFGTNLNENLRDQFVCGLRSDVIRQRLFAEDDSISFARAVQLANSLEAAERDAAIVDTPTAGESTQAVHAASSFTGRGGGGREWRPREPGSGQAGRMAALVNKSRAPRRSQPSAQRVNCAACRATNHGYSQCRYREFVCSKCQRTGHLRRVCPERQGTPAGTSSTARGRASRGDVNFGVAGRESSEEDGGEDIEANLNLLSLNNYRAV
ncbi:uncharacterized protein LOC126381202 [Pectinophora gossypiella]|uniref:uncharacterized protein LOC126381202 n=1 Tax=Pectinophora gossypiella TaxID=13191 RepID=UPI00214EA0C2|nr:uncharacterized protein LOC126381202 [Pectinophora gossypiella]